VKRESEVTKYQRQVMTVARFRAALRQFDADTALSVRRCRLTPQRYLLLLMIKGSEDGSESATVKSIASRLKMPHNTLSELAARAHDAGLITRTAESADRRSSRLSLTDEGERRLRCAVKELADQLAELRQSLDRTGS
jgi:DNA-binding MarR family transcriptional regulator